MTAHRTLVALATYNEVETLPALVEEILAVLPEADVLVVDDSSPDGTGRWCERRAANEPRLLRIHRPEKLGLGSATLDAFRYALARDYEIMLTLDADGSHDPCHLPALVEATRSADVAIGSRYCAGGRIEGWPVARRALSRLLNGLSRALLRLPIRDTSGAFRAYRLAKLRELQLDEIRAPGYAYLEEVLWQLHGAGATFVEVPITFRQRRGGASKMSVSEAVQKVRTIVGLRLR